VILGEGQICIYTFTVGCDISKFKLEKRKPIDRQLRFLCKSQNIGK
jgi:hypothetical protein